MNTNTFSENIKPHRRITNPPTGFTTYFPVSKCVFDHNMIDIILRYSMKELDFDQFLLKHPLAYVRKNSTCMIKIGFILKFRNAIIGFKKWYKLMLFKLTDCLLNFFKPVKRTRCNLIQPICNINDCCLTRRTVL